MKKIKIVVCATVDDKVYEEIKQSILSGEFQRDMTETEVEGKISKQVKATIEILE